MPKTLLMIALALSGTAARADTPGAHPAYLHSLMDLRTARWHLENRGGSEALRRSDQAAIAQIDQCVDDIKQAAAEDAKNLNEHPKEDAGKDKEGHVHRARELLRKARKDISAVEANGAAIGPRDQAIHCLDEALRRVEESLAIKK